MKQETIDPFNKPKHLIHVLRTEGETLELSPDDKGFDLLVKRLVEVGVSGDLVQSEEFIMHLCKSFEAEGVLCVRHSEEHTCVALSKPETTTL